MGLGVYGGEHSPRRPRRLWDIIPGLRRYILLFEVDRHVLTSAFSTIGSQKCLTSQIGATNSSCGSCVQPSLDSALRLCQIPFRTLFVSSKPIVRSTTRKCLTVRPLYLF